MCIPPQQICGLLQVFSNSSHGVGQNHRGGTMVSQGIFYFANSIFSIPKFLELINSSQLRKIRIPIVSDTECDRYSGLHLIVTTGEHVFFSVACSNEYHRITFAPGMCFTTTSQQCKTYSHFQIAR